MIELRRRMLEDLMSDNKIYLYNTGTINTDLAGDFTSVGASGNFSKKATYLYVISDYSVGAGSSTKAVSFTGYSKLCVDFTCTSLKSGGFLRFGVTSARNTSSFLVGAVISTRVNRLTLDLSAMTAASGYITMSAYAAYWRINKIWLE